MNWSGNREKKIRKIRKGMGSKGNEGNGVRLAILRFGPGRGNGVRLAILRFGPGSASSRVSTDSYGNTSNTSFPSRYQYTGREYDSFTGLYHYRARAYDSNLGRFMSEDPAGFVGGTNLYVYVGNNPTQFIDPHGLFPTLWYQFHQNSIARGLSGIATPGQIDALKNAQWPFDWETRDPAYAPLHAMRRPGQSPEDARRESNASIRRNICLARKLKAMGLEDQAMAWLGRAIHTMQDAASPAHYDFQVAGPLDFDHFKNEWFDPINGMADNNVRRVWNFYNNGKMPNDFFPDVMDTPNGAIYMPMRTPVSPDGGGCECE